MRLDWNIVAFPVILPWRDEFWTLPLYFPDLKVGVTPSWPPQLSYQGMPLPKEAAVHPREMQHYQPGELRQWQAFADYQKEPGQENNLIKAIRTYGQPAIPAPSPAPPDVWTLVWQLEKMQADQDAQLILVDKGEEWLQDVLRPERWEERDSFGPVDGIKETVDPDLAQLRYHLWRRVMQASLQGQAAPLLLGRTSRPLFLTLKGWPEWIELKMVRLGLPGCRSLAEWQSVAGEAGQPDWQVRFGEHLQALLTAMASRQDFQGVFEQLKKFVDDAVVARWPFPAVWTWNLEIWAPDGSPDEPAPILCWADAGTGILPG